MLSNSTLKKYNQHRKNTDVSKVCHAPFVNLNFEQNGHVTACCFNRKDVLGIYPKDSILDIWNGIPALDMRHKIESLDLDNGCKLCGILIESGNFNGSKAIHYDEFAPNNKFQKIKDFFSNTHIKWPKIFEFEISNTCNLECEMCSGYYSSTIRKNREKLPPIFDPYDDEFVHQLEPFLPYLTDMKFLGGEPFLIDRYYQIWEKVLAINPNIKVHITTNGTIFNQRVKTLLSKLRVGLIISIDSLDPYRYAEIRKGSHLGKVLKNLESFKEIVFQKNTYLTIAACVMSNNWMDMPELLRFCNKNDYHLHFNMVWNPEKFSLRFLDFHELDRIESFLSNQNFELTSKLHSQNYKVYQDMLSSISHWKLEQSHTRLLEVDLIASSKFNNIEVIDKVPSELSERFLVILEHFIQKKSELEHDWRSYIEYDSKISEMSKQLFIYLNELSQKEGAVVFLKNHFRLYPYIYSLFYEDEKYNDFIHKIELLEERLLYYTDSEKIVKDLIEDIDKRGCMASIDILKVNDIETLFSHLDTLYIIK